MTWKNVSSALLERSSFIGMLGRLSMASSGSDTPGIRHAKCVTLQLVEVAVPRELSVAILERIQRFGVPPLLRG